MITIRKASNIDISDILDIYTAAKKYMISCGNTKQWNGTYPSKELLLNDIKENQLFILEDKNSIVGVFAFILGEDPTYLEIEGQWLNNKPYGTIHRIASNGKAKNIFNITIDYCSNIINNIRIDTHEDNKIMQNLINKKGFKYCGIIYIADGSPRLAYQLEK